MNKNDIKNLLEAGVSAEDIIHDFIDLVNKVQAEDKRTAARVELEKALKNYLATFNFWSLLSKEDQNAIITTFFPTIEKGLKNLNLL